MSNSTFIADHISQKLRAGFRCIAGAEWVQIVTPFLDKRRDNMVFFAKEAPEGWILTDDGFFLEDLEMSFGEVPELVARAFDIANSSGISFLGRQLQVSCEKDEFFEGLMEAVSTSYRIMSIEPPRPVVKTIPFATEVQKRISDARLPWKPHVSFSGASGYSHHFNFEVTTDTRGQSLLRVATSSGSRPNFESYMFALTDIRATKAAVPVSMVAQRDTISIDQRRVVEKEQGSIISLADLLRTLEVPYSLENEKEREGDSESGNLAFG